MFGLVLEWRTQLQPVGAVVSVADLVVHEEAEADHVVEVADAAEAVAAAKKIRRNGSLLQNWDALFATEKSDHLKKSIFSRFPSRSLKSSTSSLDPP
jgi:uncharacterized protein YmfQ (DUF2313 family)